MGHLASTMFVTLWPMGNIVGHYLANPHPPQVQLWGQAQRRTVPHILLEGHQFSHWATVQLTCREVLWPFTGPWHHQVLAL